ncbi:MAG: hypothetical protein HY801_06780, partial [Candidatus Lindowbacteria bacterium]|nr:hypothetical protein [Candidatus Lindowbacteria bacterium]
MYVPSTTDSYSVMPATTATGTTTVTGTEGLGESDFLMLLITELANQDPLDPLADRDFIAQ